MNVLILISCLGLLSLFVGLSEGLRKHALTIVLLGVAAIFVLNAFNWNLTETRFFNDMVNFDHYAVAFTGVILAISFLVFLLSKNQYNFDESSLGDFLGIMLFTISGAIMMVSYSNIAMLFIGIETLSVSLYTLAGSKKTNPSSNESALKYFILGAFATGFLLFGITLLYGTTGSFNLAEIATYVGSNNDLPFIFYAGLTLLMVGLLFKVSAAPFHFWAPDVYEGAPNIVTSFMATVVKIAAFAAFFRLFNTCFENVIGQWSGIIVGVTALTLIIGNFSALVQSNLKRLLAYSGIANAGFMLLTILSVKGEAEGSLLYYSIAYGVASIGAFSVLIALSKEEQVLSIENLKGLSKRSPATAVLFAVILASLAGIPPTAGFFAKYLVITNSIQAGYIGLAILAIICSLVGIYYYFKVVVNIFSKSDENHDVSIRVNYLLVLCAILTLIIGIAPELIINLL